IDGARSRGRAEPHAILHRYWLTQRPSAGRRGDHGVRAGEVGHLRNARPSPRSRRRHPGLQYLFYSDHEVGHGDEVASTADRFVTTQLDKRVIRSQDRVGFIVNALLIPYILSAVRMLESGFATAEDIDMGMVKGCAHPMGPLHLADLIGLDTTMAVANSLYEEFKEPLYAPPPLRARMVGAALLGRKSGRGFYNYKD